MKKRVVAFALVLLASALPGQRLFATQNCGNQDFNGVYGILASGAITVPGFPITGPFARAGLVRGDGKGNVVFNTTASYNGFLFFNEPIQGTYTVSPDCNIVMNVFIPAPIFQPAILSGLLSNNKRDVEFMIVNPPGQTVRAVMKRQDAGDSDEDGGGCSAESLSKSYALLLQGNVVVPVAGQIPGEFVRVGKFTPDGNGHFSAETNVNYNGFLIQAENFSGTYAVARDCTVSIQYTQMNIHYAWSGALVEHSKGADLIVSDPPGSAIRGALQQQ